MAKLFCELRERLLRAGIAPRYVRRYLNELTDHLADLRAEEEAAGRSRANAEATALQRLGGVDALARAMTEKRQFQSWCVRAPWAAFGLGPIVALAAAYAVACFDLWLGWRIFLPESSTPFVRVHGFEVLYFGVGRLIYFGAPILIGWGIGVMAVRQRVSAFWPAAGLIVIALLGGTARVHAGRPEITGGGREIGMSFAFGSGAWGLTNGLIHATAIFSLTMLPYLAWRLLRGRSATV